MVIFDFAAADPERVGAVEPTRPGLVLGVSTARVKILTVNRVCLAIVRPMLGQIATGDKNPAPVRCIVMIRHPSGVDVGIVSVVRNAF